MTPSSAVFPGKYIIWKKYRLQSKAADYFIRELRKSIS